MSKQTKWIIAVIITLGLILIFAKKDKIMEVAKNTVWDVTSFKKIQTLHPKVREKAIEFINRVDKELGIKLRVTFGLRTYAEQTALYAQGRTTGGGIVTNAKAGESSHNFGTAIDVVEIKNGQANWNPDWTKIAKIGKELGFVWGGDFKSIVDKPHFEMNFGLPISELRKRFEGKDFQEGEYVRLA